LRDREPSPSVRPAPRPLLVLEKKSRDIHRHHLPRLEIRSQFLFQKFGEIGRVRGALYAAESTRPIDGNGANERDVFAPKRPLHQGRASGRCPPVVVPPGGADSGFVQRYEALRFHRRFSDFPVRPVLDQISSFGNPWPDDPLFLVSSDRRTASENR